ncbi:ATP-binding protein [Amphritea japonica]|uniref:histidine kinase n=1 Tax=Amphritea japonica ATCC BAA-1530 TaxID=1278309 RepID=A0A7R6P318_9GAMM|nr:sensor histidine kinase [Amphritea japonica]BBB24924.1 two-component system sensor histidine kinase [Amphritea japonica ATCC BAA-1530]
MRSIQSRLNVNFIVVTLVLFGLFWLGQSWFLRQMAYEFVASRLNSDAYSVLRAVEMDIGSGWRINLDNTSSVYQQPMSGHYFQVAVDGKWFYSRSLWDAQIPSTGGNDIGQENISLIEQNNKPTLVYSKTFMKQGREIQVILAEDISRIEESLSQLGWLLAGLGTLGLVVLLTLQIFIIRRGLCSLIDVKKDISRLKSGNIRQLSSTNTTEIEPLVTEINYLVQNMELRLQRSRNAVGNLAHAAKTPLTVIDRHVDVLLEEDIDQGEAIKEQSARLREMIERELTRARIAGAALPGQRIYIGEELEKLTRTLKAIYREKALIFELDISAKSYFPGERDDLVELMGNLLDNASKWAGSQVRIKAHMDDHCLELVVEDDGPGIPPDARERLLNRGERLDESTTGHGLGMSIITEIVRQYQGKLMLDSSQRLGGLEVQVVLPRRVDLELPD